MGQINEYLTTREAAEFFRVTPRTIKSYKKAGRIPFHQIARKLLFKRSELEEALNKRTLSIAKQEEVCND